MARRSHFLLDRRCFRRRQDHVVERRVVRNVQRAQGGLRDPAEHRRCDRSAVVFAAGGLVAGAASGGLAGALIGSEFPEEEARFYEAELKVNGHNKDVLIDPTGAIVEVEEQVTLESLPPAVKTALEKQAGKGKITFVESVTKGSSVVAYEAKIKTAGKTSEIKVSPDGAAVKEP